MSFTLAIGSKQPLGPGVEGDLQRLCQVLDRDDIPAQAHAAQDHHLLLDRLPEDGGAKRNEGRQASLPSSARCCAVRQRAGDSRGRRL